jgi:hypothetical protein
VLGARQCEQVTFRLAGHHLSACGSVAGDDVGEVLALGGEPLAHLLELEKAPALKTCYTALTRAEMMALVEAAAAKLESIRKNVAAGRCKMPRIVTLGRHRVRSHFKHRRRPIRQVRATHR